MIGTCPIEQRFAYGDAFVMIIGNILCKAPETTASHGAAEVMLKRRNCDPCGSKSIGYRYLTWVGPAVI